MLVLVQGGGVATIYADNNNTPLANPFQANLDGSWLFYANDGRYSIQTTRPDGLSFTYLDVLLCDPFVPGAVCSGAASGAHNLLSATHLDTIAFSPPVRGDLVTAQNLTSPTGVNPAWARLALGTSGQVLSSNGIDAVWGNLIAGTNITLSSSSGNTTINATGAGCSPPGTNTGVISEHPIGTCYDSANFTWDDGASKQNMQAGTSNTVGVQLTFSMGTANNLTGTTEGVALGETNTLTCQFCDAYGNNNQINVVGAGGAASNTDIHIYGDFNVLQGNGVNTSHGVGGQDYHVVGYNNTYKVNTTSALLSVWTLGEANNIDSDSAGSAATSINVGSIVGKSNTVQLGNGATPPSFFNVNVFGHGTSLTGGANGLQDIVLLGDSHTVTVAAGVGVHAIGYNNTLTSNAGRFNYVTVVGANNNFGDNNSSSTSARVGIYGSSFLLTGGPCSDCFFYGENATITPSSNTLYIGLSATPEITVTANTAGLPQVVTIVATAFASLGTPANGTFKYCNDCTIANPCASGGSGAFAKRLNGVWVCN